MATTRTDRFSGTPTEVFTDRFSIHDGALWHFASQHFEIEHLSLIAGVASSAVVTSTSTQRFTGTPTVVFA